MRGTTQALTAAVVVCLLATLAPAPARADAAARQRILQERFLTRFVLGTTQGHYVKFENLTMNPLVASIAGGLAGDSVPRNKVVGFQIVDATTTSTTTPLKIDSTLRVPCGKFGFTWDDQSGVVYKIWWTEDLKDRWPSNQVSTSTITGGYWEETNHFLRHRFYRLSIEVQ